MIFAGIRFVAGFGSDLAGAQGAFAVSLDSEAGARPGWAPSVEGELEASPWRSAWIYDVAADSVRRITQEGINVWQASWAGQDHIVAICSDPPEETWWYAADVRLIAIRTARPTACSSRTTSSTASSRPLRGGRSRSSKRCAATATWSRASCA